MIKSTRDIIYKEDFTIEVTYKKVKNLRITIYPAFIKINQVHVTAPLRCSKKDIDLFISSKIDWIKKHTHNSIYSAPIPKKIISGEYHSFLGKQYPIEVCYSKSNNNIVFKNDIIYIDLKEKFTINVRKELLNTWYRNELYLKIPPLLTKWEKALNVKSAECRIKLMKTRWGTCNTQAKRIWLNLELIKLDIECLDYVILHELTHFIERKHNAHFKAILTENMPHWKEIENKMKGSMVIL